MKKILITCISMLVFNYAFAQDTTAVETEDFDPNEYNDASTAKKYCTQKVSMQTPTKLIGIGYEQVLSFDNTSNIVANNAKLDGMGGIRTTLSVLALSTNKMILSIGANTWASKIKPNTTTLGTMQQVFNNRMDIVGLNALLFKPLDQKHFLIAQLNVDESHIGTTNNFAFTGKGITYYGSAIYGWKKNDYKMSGFGISRTYRLGRPLFVPIFLYNKTFNDKWGIEALLPARAALRYNFSTNNILLAGVELEGQQLALQSSSNYLQRGEIKPRIQWEKKVTGFIWLSSQIGYRHSYRFNTVNKYNGKEADETIVNTLSGAPYFNISLNFVSP